MTIKYMRSVVINNKISLTYYITNKKIDYNSSIRAVLTISG